METGDDGGGGNKGRVLTNNLEQVQGRDIFSYFFLFLFLFFFLSSGLFFFFFLFPCR